MAAKRLFDDSDNDPDLPNQKRLKSNKPTLASVIKEVLTMNLLENFCTALEPMIRRVVHEEVENGLKRNLRSLTWAPSMRMPAIDEQPSLQLIISKKLSLPIFTGTKITDADNNHLQILLVEYTRGTSDNDDAKVNVPVSLPYPIKIEIVVLDGDFPSGGDLDRWSCQEFDKNVLKERTGRRPLLAGELCVTMRDGVCSFGEIEFTDNSSWIRSRRFRLGARVVQAGSSSNGGGDRGVRIRPAMTESFVVKDHRGELYKKHYPPSLVDEVWRLEKIGKDGAFHKKLSKEGINSVQKFLQLSVVDPLKLKKVLGIGMSERMWDVTLRHAWTCEKGTKLYMYKGSNFVLILNPVCQVIRAMINGQVYGTRDFAIMHKSYIDKLVKDAYANWSNLVEVDGQVNETALLTMGDQYMGQYPIEQQQQHEPLLTDGSSGSVPNNNEQVQYNINDQWNVSYLCSPMPNAGHYYSESSPEPDLR